MCDPDPIKPSQEINIQSGPLNNLLKSFSKCKIDFANEKEECIKIREINKKLELELKEARELEKSHRYHLLSSREMIGNLQETVSQLVHLKRDMKKMKDEIVSRESTILALQRDKENQIQHHNESLVELHNNNERHIEEMAAINDRKFQQVQHETDTKAAQLTCVIEELRNKIQEMEVEHRDKMNVVVLEYEGKLHSGASQIAQLREQLERQEANIDAYKRRSEELEEKLKQSQFKQFLAQNNFDSQYENQVERPYSANRDYMGPRNFDTDPVLERATPKLTQNKKGPLQVMHYGTKNPIQKPQSTFNTTKKRKLYSEKDYQDLF